MRCPMCRDYELAGAELEPRLEGMSCAGCGGWFVRGAAYLGWVEAGAVCGEGRGVRGVGADSGPGKFCPECGHFMRRVRVGEDVPFKVNRCAACGGFWLDAGEWETLRARGLQDDLHRVFSDVWQGKLARAERAGREENLLKEMLGEADLAEIERVRAWIEGHEHWREMYAYLMAHAREGARRVAAGACAK